MLTFNDALDYGLNGLVADIILSTISESLNKKVFPKVFPANIEGVRPLNLPLAPDLDITKVLQYSRGEMEVTFRIQEEGTSFYAKIALAEDMVSYFYRPLRDYGAGIEAMAQFSPFLDNMNMNQIQNTVNSLVVAFYRDLSRGLLRRALGG